MTEEQVSERLALLRKREWPNAEIEAWFGINLAECQPLVMQYRMWVAGTYEAAYEPGNFIDRCKFEIFLDSRGLIPKRLAAFQLALAEDSFEKIMDAAADRLVSGAEARGDFPGVFRAELVSDFHKRFPNLRNKIFPSLSVCYDRLHAEIRNVLNVEVDPLRCPTAAILGEGDYATISDAITSEPMSIRFSVFLETNRPLQLRPDSCSWLTYFRFESVLRNHLLGQPPELTDQQERLFREQMLSDARPA